ncbi:YczE/YyaS/YitT family protein [Thalassobacillus pellis]|uniref:YczE/YyaS/YitT family protein n=1 Tax=Thalassobacillus pellis TaxID=748008 RepID=UPI00196121E8|nr:membrane protein [Thalassobacillus pellis]MBM7551152.1 putative membrane protein YczE [Thalassobacillus pellis]
MKYLLLFIIYLIGIVVSSLGLALIIKSGLGVGPGDSVAVGIAMHSPITVGNVLIISFVILLLINAWIEKKRPVFESLLPIIIRGWTLDLFLYTTFEGADFEVWWSKWLVFTIGLLAMGIGIAVYLRTPFPRIPLDHFMMIMNKKTKQSKSSVRIFSESFLALIGYLLGAPVGIGTLLVALLLGPIINIFYVLCRPLIKLWGLHQKQTLM